MNAPGPRGTVLQDGLHSAFPTPLLVKRFGDDDGLNQRLLDFILRREEKEPSLGLSNVGGWHSGSDLLKSKDPAITELRARISGQVEKMLALTRHRGPAKDQVFRVSAWANLARDGAYNSIHNHTPAVYSGVYYVDTGDPAPPGSRDGLIEFVDPRPGPHGGPLPTHAFNAPLIVDPEPGMLLMFPGWLLHCVHPYRGAAPRVSVAFNLWLSPAAGQGH